jgi:hypothetical protein
MRYSMLMVYTTRRYSYIARRIWLLVEHLFLLDLNLMASDQH